MTTAPRSPILKALPGLPEKPAPTRAGAPVMWIDALDERPHYYKGRRLDLSRPTLEAIAANFKTLSRNGYMPPHLAEHNRDGERLGHVLALSVWRRPDNGRLTLIAAVQFNDPGAAEKIAAEQILYFSPDLGDVEDPLTGDVVGPALRELSRTSAPHRKTGRTHILGSEQDPPAAPDGAANAVGGGGSHTRDAHDNDNPNPGATMAQEDSTQMMEPGDGSKDENQPSAPDASAQRLDALEAKMGEMGAKVEEISATMGALADSIAQMMENADKPKAEADDEGEGEKPMDVQMSEATTAIKAELDAIKAELATERRARAVAEMTAHLSEAKGKVVTLSVQMAESMADLRAAAPEAFGAVFGAAKTPEPVQMSEGDGAPEPEPEIPGPTVNPFGSVAMGEQVGGGSVEPNTSRTTITRAELRARAKEADVSPVTLLASLMGQGITIEGDAPSAPAQ